MDLNMITDLMVQHCTAILAAIGQYLENNVKVEYGLLLLPFGS